MVNTHVGTLFGLTLNISDYIKKWHVMLLDRTFKPMICADPPSTKGFKLKGVKLVELAIKQVL